MKESEIQSSIIDYLQVLENQGKLFLHRVNNMGVYDPKRKAYRVFPKGAKKGFPDIIVIKNGFLIGLEVKTGEGKQSNNQKEVEKKLKKHGAAYYVVRSLEEVVGIFDKYEFISRHEAIEKFLKG